MRSATCTHGATTPRHRAVLTALSALALVAAPSVVAAQTLRVTAAWQANNDGLTAGYRVFVGTSPGSPITSLDTGLTTSVQLPLQTGGRYYVSVRAYTSQGVMGPATSDAVVDLSGPPDAPTGVNADVNGPRATLSWSPPMSGGMPSDYLLSVGTAPGTSNLVNGHSVGDTESISGDLPPGTYFATLRAANVMGVSRASTEVSFQVGSGFRPQNPTDLSASWAGTTVRLSWSRPSASLEEVPTQYRIEAGTSSGSANVASIDVGNTTSYVVDVPPGTYYVRVRGVNARGVSDPSNELMLLAAGAPGAPRNLSASGSGSAVTLRWSAPNTGAAATGYVIEAGSTSGSSNLAVVNVGNVTTVTTTVPPGVYYVRVRSINGRGSSGVSNQIVVRR